MRNIVFGLILSSFILTSCGINPVTGERQFTLISPEQEVSLGSKQYGPSQQSQGGQYIIDPALNGYINRVGQKLARLSAQPNLPYEFVVLNNDIPNAWALPGGKIAINRGLLVLLEDEAQLAAVLGHEVVHAAARHGASQMSQGMLLQLGTQVVGAATQNSGYAQLAGIGASAFQARYGRSQELESDKYGMEYMVKAGYNPQAAVELQQTFLRLSHKGGAQRDWLSSLFASHPPSAERVTKNQARVNRYPAGIRNKAAYQRAIRQLIRDKEAYGLHTKALQAAGKKQWQQALSLTRQAIRQQPREARFHITQARLLENAGKDRSALKALDRASRLEPNYFASFLYRGLINQRTKNYASAQRDFLASNKLFETQPANFYLGEIAQRSNQRNNAIRYYRKATQGGGNIGKAAAARLQKLGIK